MSVPSRRTQIAVGLSATACLAGILALLVLVAHGMS